MRLESTKSGLHFHFEQVRPLRQNAAVSVGKAWKRIGKKPHVYCKTASKQFDALFRKQVHVPVDEKTSLQNAAVGILTGARSVTKADAQR